LERRCYRDAVSSLDRIELDAKEYTDELSEGEEPCWDDSDSEKRMEEEDILEMDAYIFLR
jgi:hypothetical protein